MNLAAYQELVTGHYLFESMPDNVGDSWFRYVCTDGKRCKEVEHDYQPRGDELVFSCSITFGRAKVELFKSGGEVENAPTDAPPGPHARR